MADTDVVALEFGYFLPQNKPYFFTCLMVYVIYSMQTPSRWIFEV